MKTKLTKRSAALQTLTIIAVLLIQNAIGQSNYASHANNVEYLGKGLPEEATLDGKVTKLDELRPFIYLNRTKAALNCAAGSMQIEMRFTEPFYGLAYADFDRNSACQTLGKGELSVRLELPLKGCGTKQEPQRVFTNNVVVRFHPGLEIDGDEIITIVCRYPPPIAPIPVSKLEPLLVASPAQVAPLKGAQILFIICAIMFLTLLLLGLAVSYYCLSRRTIPVVRRLPMSIGSGSEITKLSSSTYGNMPPFEGLKIPRAHAVVAAAPSASSSDDNPLIPSDYPSESQSEVEIDTRSLPGSSAGSYENRAYVQENSSIYSEHYGHTQEFQAANAVAQPLYSTRLPIAAKEPSPTFDVQVRVKRAAPTPPPLSSFSSDTESLATSLMDRNNLSTIMETHEDRESVMTIDSLPQDVAHSQFTYVPELHPAPLHAEQPPRITTISKSYEQMTHEESWDDYPDSVPAPRSIPETRSIVSTETRNDLHSVSEMVETSHLYQRQPPETIVSMPIEEVERLAEPPIVAKKPEITSHLVDDVFLRTITEKTTIEDIEKYKRMVTEYKAKPPVKPTFDVTIRNYPNQDRPQWEDFSDVSSISTVPTTSEPPKYSGPPPTCIDESGAKLTSPELVGNMKPIEIPPEDKAVPNWDVLIRVLEQQEEEEAPPIETIVDDVSSTYSQHAHEHILQRQISYDDKIKWRDIITTESTLRTMLTEAVVREDFERIRSDTRYETLFEPRTWDVLIRILAPPDDVELRLPKRKGKKEPWDTRSRRSSLPTLYEYDSDGGSSVRTIPQDMLPTGSANTYQYPPQSRRTSRSSYNADMRSMTEVMVNFARPESDNISDVSSYYPNRYYDDDPYDRRSIQRSLSQPSLARSATEITERWVIPDDESEGSDSPRNSSRLTTFQPRLRRPQHVTTETQYMQQSSSSTFQATSTSSPPKDWYGGDNTK